MVLIMHNRRELQRIATIGIFLLLVPAAVADESITFADVTPGGPIANFEAALTGRGQPGNWQVIADESAREGRALAQLSKERISDRFPLAIHKRINETNVEITAWFQPISGSVDRAAGVVARFVDANNYYVARASVTAHNVSFHRVVGGKHQQLAAANVFVVPGEWHGLTLLADRDQFTVTYNGKVVLTATDDTIRSAGKVGLWTRADSVILFDWLIVRALQ
jgi:hypothetical protein